VKKLDFEAAVKKPFGNAQNFVVAIILYLLPIVNAITIPGYMIRIAGRTMKKDKKLPGFENFGELIVDSLKYIVMSIVYMIPSMIAIAIAVLAIFEKVFPVIQKLVQTLSSLDQQSLQSMAGVSGENMLQALGIEAIIQEMMQAGMEGLSAAALPLAIGAILWILGAILIVTGTMNYAKTRQFSKAFAVVENFKSFFRADFIIALIVAVILSIVVSGIAGMLMGILAAIGLGLIGILIMLAANLLVQIASITLMAEAWAK